jgi:hypothetical protein
MRRLVLVVALLGSCQRQSPPAQPTPVAPISVIKVLPTYAEMAVAPPCVRAVAELRLAVAELRLSGRGHGALPGLGDHWAKMRDTQGSFVPMDLRKGWDEPIAIGLVLTEDPTLEMRTALEAGGMRIAGSGVGTVLWGAVPLHQLVCVAELPFVQQMELNDPTRDHID